MTFFAAFGLHGCQTSHSTLVQDLVIACIGSPQRVAEMYGALLMKWYRVLAAAVIALFAVFATMPASSFAVSCNETNSLSSMNSDMYRPLSSGAPSNVLMESATGRVLTVTGAPTGQSRLNSVASKNVLMDTATGQVLIVTGATTGQSRLNSGAPKNVLLDTPTGRVLTVTRVTCK